MRRWFLSYHSPDQAMAERLKAVLERKDMDAQVFFAPSSLRAGSFWSRRLAEEIAQADAFILLVGKKGVGDWQVLEYDEALAKRVNLPDFPVILVLLEGQKAPGLPFLRRLHWIITSDPSSEKDVDRLFDAVSGSETRPDELWRYTSPYRGLAAMTEKDNDYFFGRENKTVEVVEALAATQGEIPILLGNSGVGKSSLAQAGVLAALKRQTWPEGADKPPEWPNALRESRRWCFLTLKPGTEPLKALVDAFFDTWEYEAGDPARTKRRNEWIDLLLDVNEKATLSDLIDETERRYRELDRTKPPAFLIYVDQSEELYVRAEEQQRHRFSEVMAQGIADPRLHMLMSMRAGFLGDLQKDEPLFRVNKHVNVPPLREPELREVVSRPAELLSARFDAGLADIITRRTAEDSVKDVGTLPLLSYTLDDMWTRMINRGDGVLRLPAQSFELGGVLVNRADKFLDDRPKSQEQLRRIFTLKLATVREGEEPTRRRALRSEFSAEEWRLVSELAYDPYRLLVTATPKSEDTDAKLEHEAYAEVAHETIFRRWGKLRDWIAAEYEFLAWKTGLEAARRAWQVTPDAVLMGFPLSQAVRWLAKRSEDIPTVDRDFIEFSRKASQRQAMFRGAVIGVLAFAIVASVIGWLYQDYLGERLRYFVTIRPYMRTEVRPYVLTAEQHNALKPGDPPFKECAKDAYCPWMVVVPAGEFMMGSASNEKGRDDKEGPQHKVVFAKPFAVSMFEVTFDDWDACVNYGDCPRVVNDSGYGRGQKPVINVTWAEAQRYVAWLSRMTGKTYRLLSEAEWEYAARAGTTTAYSWGDEIGKGNANCESCGSQWDNKQTAPVGSFSANAFALHDMHGNVWEWVEDCAHNNYEGAPQDGAAWTAGGDCAKRVNRGGSYNNPPELLRAASRIRNDVAHRNDNIGFRVARTLDP